MLTLNTLSFPVWLNCEHVEYWESIKHGYGKDTYRIVSTTCAYIDFTLLCTNDDIIIPFYIDVWSRRSLFIKNISFYRYNEFVMIIKAILTTNCLIRYRIYVCDFITSELLSQMTTLWWAKSYSILRHTLNL